MFFLLSTLNIKGAINSVKHTIKIFDDKATEL